jgi:hypothetical protein
MKPESNLRALLNPVGGAAPWNYWAQAVAHAVDYLLGTLESLVVSGSITNGDSAIFTRDDFTPLTTPSNTQATLFAFALDAYQAATPDAWRIRQDGSALGRCASCPGCSQLNSGAMLVLQQ